MNWMSICILIQPNTTECLHFQMIYILYFNRKILLNAFLISFSISLCFACSHCMQFTFLRVSNKLRLTLRGDVI